MLMDQSTEAWLGGRLRKAAGLPCRCGSADGGGSDG
jgi:hypothetical protein